MQVGLQVKDAVTLHWEPPAGGCFDYPRPKRAMAGNVLPGLGGGGVLLGAGAPE